MAANEQSVTICRLRVSHPVPTTTAADNTENIIQQDSDNPARHSFNETARTRYVFVSVISCQLDILPSCFGTQTLRWNATYPGPFLTNKLEHVSYFMTNLLPPTTLAYCRCLTLYVLYVRGMSFPFLRYRLRRPCRITHREITCSLSFYISAFIPSTPPPSLFLSLPPIAQRS